MLPMNHGVPADSGPENHTVVKAPATPLSKALSMAHQPNGDISTRKVAILTADGFDAQSLMAMQKALEAKGAVTKIVAPHRGNLVGSGKETLHAHESFITTSSVLFDAVYVAGGEEAIENLLESSASIHFLNEAYLHCKAIAAEGGGVDFLDVTYIESASEGVILPSGKSETKSTPLADRFIAAIGQHRFWNEEMNRKVPA